MQLTTVSVAIHDRDTLPDEPGVIVMTLHTGPSGFVFQLREIGAEDPSALTLTDEELAALPAARAHLLDQFSAPGPAEPPRRPRGPRRPDPSSQPE